MVVLPQHVKSLEQKWHRSARFPEKCFSCHVICLLVFNIQQRLHVTCRLPRCNESSLSSCCSVSYFPSSSFAFSLCILFWSLSCRSLFVCVVWLGFEPRASNAYFHVWDLEFVILCYVMTGIHARVFKKCRQRVAFILMVSSATAKWSSAYSSALPSFLWN